MTSDYRPNLARSFERHLRAENRSERTIATYLESVQQAEAFLHAQAKTSQAPVEPPWRHSSGSCYHGGNQVG